MSMLTVNGGGGGCGCPALNGLGLDSNVPADTSGVTWTDYEALLTSYQQQGLTLTQAQAAAASKVTSGPAGTINSICANLDAASCQAAINYYGSNPASTSLIPGVPNTYLIMGAAALLLMMSMQR